MSSDVENFVFIYRAWKMSMQTHRLNDIKCGPPTNMKSFDDAFITMLHLPPSKVNKLERVHCK